MSRRLVILPVDFSGPWSMGFSCPLRVSPTGFWPASALAVLVTDPSVQIPEAAVSVELNHDDTLASVLSRSGLQAARREPPAPFVPPSVVEIPLAVIPPAEDITDPPVCNPVDPEPAPPANKPGLLARIRNWFS